MTGTARAQHARHTHPTRHRRRALRLKVIVRLPRQLHVSHGQRDGTRQADERRRPPPPAQRAPAAGDAVSTWATSPGVSGEALRRQRIEAGLTQAALAAAAGLPRSTVAALEHGRRLGPRATAAHDRLASTLARLAPRPQPGGRA